MSPATVARILGWFDSSIASASAAEKPRGVKTTTRLSLASIESAQLAEALPVRGAGLLLGLETARPAAAVVADCLDLGLLVTAAGEHVLRLTPPLTVSPDEVAQAASILQEVLG